MSKASLDNTHTRRGILKIVGGTAMAAPAAAILVPLVSDAVVSSAEDADLLNYTTQLQLLTYEWFSKQNKCDALGRKCHEEAWKLALEAGVPDIQENWKPGDADTFLAFLKQVQDRNPQWPVLEREAMDLDKKREEICEKIIHLRAKTTTGLAAKAYVALDMNDRLTDREFADLSIRDRLLVDLVHSCLTQEYRVPRREGLDLDIA